MDQQFTEKLPLIKKDVEGIIATATAIDVRSKEALDEAANMRMQIRKRETRIDAVRKELIAPYQDQVKTYNAAFKAESDKLAQARAILESKMEAFMKVEELRALEAQRQIDEKRKADEKEAQEKAEALRKEAEQAATPEKAEELHAQAQEAVYAAQLTNVPAEQAQATLRTESGTLSRKKVLAYEVYDQETFVRARPDLCMPDPKKVREWMMEQKQEYDGEGIRVFQQAQFSGR